MVPLVICSKIAHGLNCLDQRRRGSGRGGGGEGRSAAQSFHGRGPPPSTHWSRLAAAPRRLHCMTIGVFSRLRYRFNPYQPSNASSGLLTFKKSADFALSGLTPRLKPSSCGSTTPRLICARRCIAAIREGVTPFRCLLRKRRVHRFREFRVNLTQASRRAAMTAPRFGAHSAVSASSCRSKA